MRAVGVLLAIALALALQTTLARFVVGGSVAISGLPVGAFRLGRGRKEKQ